MNYCVYIHKTVNDEIFYVGSGSLTRPYETQGRLPSWWEKAGNNYSIEIIKTGLTKNESYQLERELILKYGRINNKTGILVNKNDGICEQPKKVKVKKVIDDFKNQKVINIETGEIYNSIEDAAKDNKISLNFLIRQLKGINFNRTNLRFY